MCCIPILPFPAMSLHGRQMVHSDYSPRRTPPRPVGLLVVSRTPSRAYDFRSGERADALSFLSQNNSLELTRLRFKRAAVIAASDTGVRRVKLRVRMFFCEIPDRQPSPGALLPGRATVRGPSGRAPARAAASAVGRSRGTRARALLTCSAVSSLLSVRTSNAPTFFPIRI